jgi:hypothetical protein
VGFVDGFLRGGRVGVEGVFGGVDEGDGVFELWRYVSRCLFAGVGVAGWHCGVFQVISWLTVMSLPQVFRAVPMVEARVCGSWRESVVLWLW